MNTRMSGSIGEADAYRFLKQSGMRPLSRNYRRRSGEIDLICMDKDVVVFIEVKSRSSSLYGTSAEAVTFAKQKQIVKTALLYLKENGLFDAKIRFDVIAIDAGEIRHIRSAFDATGIL